MPRRPIPTIPRQTSRAIVRRGQMITYPPRRSGQPRIPTLIDCLRSEGWNPQVQGQSIVFPQAGYTISFADLAACNLAGAPPPIANDLRQCLEAQGVDCDQS